MCTSRAALCEGATGDPASGRWDEFAFRMEQIVSLDVARLVSSQRNLRTNLRPIVQLMRFGILYGAAPPLIEAKVQRLGRT